MLEGAVNFDRGFDRMPEGMVNVPTEWYQMLEGAVNIPIECLKAVVSTKCLKAL